MHGGEEVQQRLVRIGGYPGSFGCLRAASLGRPFWAGVSHERMSGLPVVDHVAQELLKGGHGGAGRRSRRVLTVASEARVLEAEQEREACRVTLGEVSVRDGSGA